MTIRNLFLLFLSAVLLALGPASAAFAQSYPTKPIRVLVPFPPGGPADILARLIAQKLGEKFDRQVIVENRPGANTIVGAEMVANAPADGHTLLMAIDSTLSMNPSLYAKLRYDPIRDLAPVALIATVPLVLAANNAFPPNTVQEVIALAKAKPGEINVGAGAIVSQLGSHLFNAMAGTKMVLVPYKGGNIIVAAVMGGEVPLIFTSAAQVLPAWRAGKLKILAVMGSRRLPNAPEISTIAESGVPGYDVFAWQSIVVRAGTSQEIIARLNAELVRIMDLPEMRERLLALGLEPAVSTPGELAALIRAETAKWSKVIRDSNFKVD